jgi:hypothetical protein
VGLGARTAVNDGAVARDRLAQGLDQVERAGRLRQKLAAADVRDRVFAHNRVPQRTAMLPKVAWGCAGGCFT